MAKKEKDVSANQMRITVANPEEKAAEKLAEKKRVDKLNAMKIAMSYIEIQRLKCDEKQTTAIADKFLEWLEK